MKMKLALMSLLLVATMSLCACGNSDSSSDVSKPDSSAETSVTTTTTTTTTTTPKPETTTTTATTTVTTTTAVSETSDTEATTVSSEEDNTTTTKNPYNTTTTTKKKMTSATTTTKKPTTTTTSGTTMKPNPVYEKYGHDQDSLGKFINRIDNNTGIPVINISTKDSKAVTSREVYTDCIVDLFSCDNKYVITGAEAGIKVRGNSTAYYGDVSQILKNQVPYRIKFDTKTNMLGLNDGAQCKSWVLLKSNWNLISDYMGFKLGSVLVEPDNFCSDCQLVHVYVNKVFKGVYLLCEQTQVNKNRVDIYEPVSGYKGNDIGFLVEIDNYASDDEGPWFEVNYNNNATVTDIQGTTRAFESSGYSIKNDIYAQSQNDFIKKYINGVFTIMYEACENDNFLTFDDNYDLVKAPYTNAKDTISAVADLDSIVNMYILDELVHDNDCGEGSFFMAVDFSANSKMKKLTFTAPWDYNWGYEGNATGKYYAGAFNDKSFVNQFGDRTNPWYVLLMTEDWFRDMVSARWKEVYTSSGLKKVIADAKDECMAHYEEYSKKQEWAPECGVSLAEWVEDRMKWLNKQWG